MSSSLSYTATIVLEKSTQSGWDSALSILPNASKITVLSIGKAVEAEFFTPFGMETQKELSEKLESLNVRADICVQRSNNRKKKLLICDMDSTLIGQECIDELADFAGVKTEVSDITERAMQGDIDFEGALKERVKLLENLPLSALDECFKTRITLNTGAKILAHTMKAHGAKTVIVSGGFTYFTARIKKLAGFDDDQANRLIADDEKLLGTVGLPILGREAKLKALRHYVEPLGTEADSLAIGDGANDLAMIEAAGLGIAYYAKPKVAEAAHCAINVTDLTTALYFQGYKDTEFVKNRA